MSEEAHHGTGHYIKIYFILLALLIVSLVGPEIGIQWVTLVTAFGIAFVKAYMVCAHFMHLNIEKKIIIYMLSISIVLMLVFFFGTASDIMKVEGLNWQDCLTLQTENCVEQRIQF